MKYSLEDLKKVHFDALKSTKSGGYYGQPIVSVILHRNRPNKKIGRNELRITRQWMMDQGVITEKQDIIPLMCANFPADKLQVAFYPSGLDGIKKDTKTDKAGNIAFGVGGLIDALANGNGIEIARNGAQPANKRNYFYAQLNGELVYEKGKMKVYEFSLDKKSINHEYRP